MENKMVLQFTLVHPTNAHRNMPIRIIGENDLEQVADILNVRALFELCGTFKIEVRKATEQEVKELDDLEMDMEAHEPNVGYMYPDQAPVIKQLVADWANPLTIAELLHIVASECRDSCSTAETAHTYIMKHHSDRTTSSTDVWAILKILNFAAIREDSIKLMSITA